MGMEIKTNEAFSIKAVNADLVLIFYQVSE